VRSLEKPAPASEVLVEAPRDVPGGECYGMGNLRSTVLTDRC
jgi:hypothetical protein